MTMETVVDVAAQYEAAYREWWQECQRVEEHNKRLVEELQEALDEPYDLWLLHYGVVAADEGEMLKYAVVKTVPVLEGEPDKAGFWHVLNDEHTGFREVKYCHVVAVEKLRDLMASMDCGFTVWHFFPDELRAYSPPGKDVTELVEGVRGEMLEKPREPKEPDLDYRELWVIKDRIDGLSRSEYL